MQQGFEDGEIGEAESGLRDALFGKKAEGAITPRHYDPQPGRRDAAIALFHDIFPIGQAVVRQPWRGFCPVPATTT